MCLGEYKLGIKALHLLSKAGDIIQQSIGIDYLQHRGQESSIKA
jgi:hypothetical protein